MISAPSTVATAVRHDRRGSPSTSTVQVPQPPCWQPAFGLVMSSSSRRTCSSGVSGELVISCSMPLTVSLMQAPCRDRRGRDGPGPAASSAGTRRTRARRRHRGVSRFLRGPSASAFSAYACSTAWCADPPPSGRRRRRRSRSGPRCGRPRTERTACQECECGRRRAAYAGPPSRSSAILIWGTRRPSGPAARKSSTLSVRSPPAPTELTRASTAISAAWRSPRGLSTPGGAQRFPPTVACARITVSATFAAASATRSPEAR